jgi:nicotinate-nucleotide adenylyltransferase
LQKRVGIFGGSFDPVHNGHIQIARSFLNSGLVQQLLILLTPLPPHKRGMEQAEYSHRFEMLKLAFDTIDHVQVSNLEKNLPQPSYTLQTIEHLQRRYPDTVFFLCIGEDSLRDFYEWHEYKKILERVNLIVAKRPGIDSSAVDPKILEKVIFINHDPVSVSSTQIREKNGEWMNNLPSAVVDYIKKHNLY